MVVRLHSGCVLPLKGANQEREANLHGVVEAARVQTGEACDLFQPVIESISMHAELMCCQGGTAAKREEGLDGLDQLWLVIQWPEQLPSEVYLGALIGDTDKCGDAQTVQTVHVIGSVTMVAERERCARILVGTLQATHTRVVATDANINCGACIASQVAEQRLSCALERRKTCPRWGAVIR